MRPRQSLSDTFVLIVIVLICLILCADSRNGGRGGGGVGLGLGSGRSGSSGKSGSGQNTRGAFLAGGGVAAGYTAYKGQQSTYYSRRERSGMSAFGILALILGIIGAGTMAWFCYMIGVPLWRDRQRRRSSRGIIENLPLQETPSTATPSP